MTVSKNQERTNTIKWIERGILEQHSLSDHRKYIIWRILSPYLLNVKKLPTLTYKIIIFTGDNTDKVFFEQFPTRLLLTVWVLILCCSLVS